MSSLYSQSSALNNSLSSQHEFFEIEIFISSLSVKSGFLFPAIPVRTLDAKLG